MCKALTIRRYRCCCRAGRESYVCSGCIRSLMEDVSACELAHNRAPCNAQRRLSALLPLLSVLHYSLQTAGMSNQA